MSPDMISRSKKGFSPLVLAAFLIIIVIGVVMGNITNFFGNRSVNEGVIALKSDIYFVRNALAIASSYYLPECFRHSLYQSMHNNSARGGWMQIPEGTAITYEKKTYSLWSINGRDLSPKAKDFSDALWQSFVMNLGQSLREKEAIVLVKITLPNYSPEDISLSNVGNLKVHVTAKASSPLIASKRNGEDLIQFLKNADISRDFDSPYFLLYEKAKAYHSEILPKMVACSSAEIDKSEVSTFYTATASVVQDYGSNTNGRCLVKVEIATTQKYLLSDERKLLYQPIKLTFLETMGDDYRNCIGCRGQGKSWCIGSQACEEITQTAPCAGKPAITASCDALSRTSCEDCLSGAPEGEQWLWCKTEGVCAQTCPGESATDSGGCQPAAPERFTFMNGDRIIDSVSGDMLFEYDSPSGMWSSSDWGLVDTEDMLVYIDYNLEEGFVYIRGDWTVSRQYLSSDDLIRDLENGFGEE